MNSKTIFAVVDLETTGNSTHDDNRIIQIGCALVQNNKIIRVFSTDVNAEAEIPPRITKLTGITNDEIKTAPTFASIADQLHKLLSNTVFVAHNVNFDFPFLNHEFERVGRPPLKIKAMDTVTLSQILLPTVPSFRLRDMTSYFNIEHDHPHAADSDAVATAHLFLILMKRLQTLPVPTLKSILGLNLKLPLDTDKLIQSTYQRNVQQKQPLQDYLMQRDGLVIRRFNNGHHEKRQPAVPFPVGSSTTSSAFTQQVPLHADQLQMMHRIYDHFSQPGADKLLVTAGPDVEARLGYGVPMAYLGHNQHQKVVVSFANANRENDFLNRTLPVIKQLAGFNINDSVLKSADNYIDLNRFFVTLKVPNQPVQTQFIKARILVWLTMTKTGDLGELGLTNNAPFLSEIRHQGIRSIRPIQPFYRFDFLRRTRNRNKYSQLLVTTHDYLLSHAKQISQQNQSPLLTVDNAMALQDAARKANQQTIELNHIDVLIRKLMVTLQNAHTRSIVDILGNQKPFKKSLRNLSNDLDAILMLLDTVQRQFAKRFLGPDTLDPAGVHFVGTIDSAKLRDAWNQAQPQFANLKRRWKACFENANRIISGPEAGYSLKDLSVIHHFQALVFSITRELQNYRQVHALLEHHGAQTLVSVHTNQRHELNNTFLEVAVLLPKYDLSGELFRYFPTALLTAQLAIPKHIQSFGADQMGLGQHYQVETIGNFKRAQPVYLLNDGPLIGSDSENRIASHYADVIWRTLQRGPQKNYFLFSSKRLLQSVFHQLVERRVGETYNLMAEGISGNQGKLMKNILNDGQLTVLGTFETLTLNHLAVAQFESIMVVDLPLLFNDSPKRRFITHQVAKANPDSFQSFRLPNAILMLNRALALTNPHQLITVLDSRISELPYGGWILATLADQFDLTVTQSTQLDLLFAKFY